MTNYDSNYDIAQEISARIGNSPIPFDSVYSICLEIYNELGGEPAQFDSVYEILLGILPLVEGGGSKVIDDTSIRLDKTWSSSKINEEIQAVAGTANSEIEGKQTEDFTFAQTLPASGEEDQLVIIKGENTDTLYKYVSGSWFEQTPDATKLYFDTENEALYSYVSADHQFAPVSLVNTIIVGSNLNTNTALKAIKTPGVYSVVQRLHSSTKGDYIKNWTLTVEGIDYDEYERTDSIYQRIQSNYTIQKRTWSSTRVTNNGWSNFSTYYAGEIKDSTVSKYYTWSSSKLNASLGAKQDILTAGDNISIEDGKINTIGYKAGMSITDSFVELPEFLFEPYIDMTSRLPSTDLNFTGAAGTTTYTVSGVLTSMLSSMVGSAAFQVGNGPIALLTVYDSTNNIVTLDKSLSNNALNNTPMSKLYIVVSITLSGAANTTTYTYIDTMRMVLDIFRDGAKIKIDDYPITKVIALDSGNNTVTFEDTLDSENAVSNAEFKYAFVPNNIASGICAHAEGQNTTASAMSCHAEGSNTTTSGYYSHAEGYGTKASGEASHAEGSSTIASGRSAHSEGWVTSAQNRGEHAEGNYNASHKASDTYGNAGNTTHSVGIGTGSAHKKNAFEIMENGDMYVFGVGGYQGDNTNVQDPAIKTLQAYIASLEARINALEGNTTVE